MRQRLRPEFGVKQIGIDDPRVPPRHFFVAEVQGLAGAVREVGDHHIGPFDEAFEDLRAAL